jgi:hypothetical protein
MTSIEDEQKRALEMLGDIAAARTGEEASDALEWLADALFGYEEGDKIGEEVEQAIKSHPMSAAEALIGLALLFSTAQAT